MNGVSAYSLHKILANLIISGAFFCAKSRYYLADSCEKIRPNEPMPLSERAACHRRAEQALQIA
jgi:hypothetical protein